ncbi:MAG: hypothetical protein ACRC3H_25325 [Lachnospiraceae bacterium]
MKIENLIIIDGKEVELESLPEYEKIVDDLNKNALAQINYIVKEEE